MANLSEDIQCAGFDTRPPMLDRTDFASWRQRIRLYCRGKENGVKILKPIDEGPFQMWTLRETLTEGTEGALHLGPEQPRVYSDLTPEEKDRFVTSVKLNRGLRDSNYDQLYAYLKQHEHFPQSSTTSPSSYVQPHSADTTQLDSRLSLTDNLIENLTNTLALLSQSYKTYLPQTNNQLRTSSNPRNQATIQDGKVVIQNVQGRHNRGQGNNAWGTGAAGYGGAQNRVGYANLGQARYIKCYNCNGIGHIVRNHTQPKRPQNSEYFKDKMLLMQAQENGVKLDEEQLLFIVGGQDNVVDADVDEQPIQDLTLNVDNVFQADDCDAFDFDVNEAPTAQTMFMANLSSVDPVYDEAGPSYDSDVLFEVHDHDHYQDAVCEHHEVHEMQDDVQPNYVVDSHTGYTSDSNMIPYNQYVKDNAVQVVQSNVSAVPNDAYMTILNDMYEPPVQHVSVTTQTNVVAKSLTAELATYKEQVELKAAIGYKSPLCLTHAKQVQPTLYNGHEIIKTDHISAIVHNSEDTLKIAEITRNKMNEKMKTPLWTQHKINIRPPDYSKDIFLATFTPQTQLTPEQIYWSKDILEMKTEALKEQAKAAKPIKALTVYPPNTPVKLVPRDIQKALTIEIKEMKTIFDELEAEVDQNDVNIKCDESERKNILIANDTLIANCLSKEVFYIATNSELNVSKFSEMHKAHNVVQTRCLELETELSKLKDKIKKDDHEVMVKRFSNLETNAMLTENENIKVQINAKLKCVTLDSVTPKVLAPGMYAIDVEPLKESVATLREIVEEAKVERPLDRSVASACLYTKHSQELLEYLIGTCPKYFNKRDKKQATTPLNIKKQVTFANQCETSNTNTQKHGVQQITQKTNVPVLPSTRVDSCTDASRSKPMSNTKKNSISPAKSVDKKTVEDHSRTNKSHLQKPNRVDSSISSERTVINLNSDSVCKTCCSKHMIGDRSRLRNFVKKFIGTVRFGNDHFGAIMGYGDYVIGDSVISRVYYVEGLGHNLFSVGQLCDSDLEVAFRKHSCYVRDTNGVDLIKVAFRKHSCYVRDTNGVDLIKGSRAFNLYTISVEDMMKSSPICLYSKASKTKSWLWHRRLNHLTFGSINDLARKDLSVPRTPQQNDIVKRQNQTLVEAARTMLIFSKAPMFLWAEAVATACYTQNRSLIHTRHHKTPYEPVHNKKPDLTFLRVFRTLCYLTNDSKDLGKLQPTADIGIFVGYAPSRKGPAPTFFTPGQISSGLVPNLVPASPYVPPTNKDLEILFQPMFDKYMEPPRVNIPVSPAPVVPVHVNSAGTPSSTAIDQDAPSPSHSSSSLALQSLCLHHGIAAESTLIDENPFAPIDKDPFINIFALKPTSAAS
nr:integrase, catalytic region, zinc finger, CCHC-type, peptidase aspartic, catalytic [Tanacetum cinerariifolium]